MRYKSRTKDCKLIIRARSSFGECFDEKALDVFARVYVRGFLRVKPINKNVMEYSGPVGISLHERLKRPMTKRDFMFIMEQIVVAVQKIQSIQLQFEDVVLDLHYVFVNDVTKEIQFLYVPMTRGSVRSNVIEFIESIVYSAIPVDEKDSDFISRFIYFIRSQNGFCPETVEKFIAKEDRSVVNTIKRQNAGQSGFMTSKQIHYYDHYDGQKHETENPEEKQQKVAVVSKESATKEQNSVQVVVQKQQVRIQETVETVEEEATGVLDEEATGVLEEEATGVLDEEATGVLEEEATGVLNEEMTDGVEKKQEVPAEKPPVSYPVLFRVLTEETISINKPVFRLGKERSYVDYFVTNNNAVSRSHADIVTRGAKYYVIDLNSKNHTYINDQVIAIQSETEICDEDKLRLGNEEFIFRLTKPKRNISFCAQCGSKITGNVKFCTNCGTRIER